MNTVFSYIVQKRLSQENENVATEALAFILRSSERARTGLMKLLRGIAPHLPDLRFRTQQTEGDARPDLWGFDGVSPRVFIENKFWAGLTENQPVGYLKLLARFTDPAVLLMVVPAARLETVWRELKRRLHDANLSASPRDASVSAYRVAAIDLGPPHATTPILAITSWAKMLSAIDVELIDEPQHRNDLFQLRALCDAADEQNAPFSTLELTNQRTPSFIQHLNSVVQGAVNLGVTEGVLSVKGLNPAHYWVGLGRYIRFPNAMGVGAWFGTHFKLWREHGSTPLWLYFSTGDFGRSFEVRDCLEPWIEQKGMVSSTEDDGGFSVGVNVVAGEEPDHVIRSILDRLWEISTKLSVLPAKLEAAP